MTLFDVSKEDLQWVNARVSPWKGAIKRLLDFLLALAGLAILSPLILLIAAIVKFSSRGPLIFGQERIGRFGRPFQIYKFRTMVSNALELGGFETSSHDPRITPVGGFLRNWSLDELPQLWNILKGEMSFVGPRPTLRYQVEAYTARERRRLLVMPGLSGLAQVRGRNELSWPEKIEWDLRYIENYSLGADAKILLESVALVLAHKGVYGN